MLLSIDISYSFFLIYESETEELRTLQYFTVFKKYSVSVSDKMELYVKYIVSIEYLHGVHFVGNIYHYHKSSPRSCTLMNVLNCIYYFVIIVCVGYGILYLFICLINFFTNYYKLMDNISLIYNLVNMI